MRSVMPEHCYEHRITYWKCDGCPVCTGRMELPIRPADDVDALSLPELRAEVRRLRSRPAKKQ